MSERDLCYDDLVRIADLMAEASKYHCLHLRADGIEVEVERLPVEAPHVVSGAAAMARDVARCTVVTAPAVGTVRWQVGPGERVDPGTTLGHVDVLGEGIPVLAPQAATVARVLAGEGMAVGYGQPLVELRGA